MHVLISFKMCKMSKLAAAQSFPKLTFCTAGELLPWQLYSISHIDPAVSATDKCLRLVGFLYTKIANLSFLKTNY